MEEKILKVVKVSHEDPLEDLNKPEIGGRYLYCHYSEKTQLKEGWVAEISTSGCWIKMFNGKIAEWIHFEGFGVFEALGDAPLFVKYMT